MENFKMSENVMDRRVRKTKKLLLDGLTEIMEEKSINDITVRELADKVDINRSTFYLHYQDIYDMIKHIEDDLMNKLNELLGPVPQSESFLHSEEKLAEIIKDTFDFLCENRSICKVLLGHNGDIKFLNRVSDNITQRMNVLLRSHLSGNYTEFDFELANKFFVTGCIGLVQHWLNADDDYFKQNDSEHMTALFMDLFKNGSAK